MTLHSVLQRSGRVWLINGLLVFLSLALVLFAAEVVLRIANIDAPALYCYDNLLGYRLSPGATGEYTKEGYSQFRVNQYGMLRPPIELEKPASMYRIALLGDSYIEALQVSYDNSVTKQLEKQLGKKVDKPVQVLPFAASGFGTAQQLLMLQNQVFSFQPDLVLLAFLPGNDLVDNSAHLLRSPYKPYFTLDKSGHLVPDNAFRNSFINRFRRSVFGKLLYWLRERSVLVRVLRYRIATLSDNEIASNETASSETAKGNQPKQIFLKDLPKYSTHRVFDPDPDLDWKQAWSITEALISAINDECLEQGVLFGMVILTTGVLVCDDERKVFKKRYPDLDPDYPERRLIEYARSNNIPALALTPYMLARAKKTDEVFHGFADNLCGGHWNESGHRVAAQLIAEWVETSKLLKQ